MKCYIAFRLDEHNCKNQMYNAYYEFPSYPPTEKMLTNLIKDLRRYYNTNAIALLNIMPLAAEEN